MTKRDLAAVLEQWRKALFTFEEALAADETSITRDAAIKRFEYNFELAWKAIKRFALQRKAAENARRPVKPFAPLCV